MSMFTAQSHYLAFGSTDQQTLRRLTPLYDGIVVPGTIAAYQADGTQGFVLSLSALTSHPYVIDPRSPLFQLEGVRLKPSHVSLARVLGLEDAIGDVATMNRINWTPELAGDVARKWFAFNERYHSVEPKVFSKYAKRLGSAASQLNRSEAQRPSVVLAPYLMEGTQDIRDVNEALWSESVVAAEGSDLHVRRVIAVEEPTDLTAAVIGANRRELALWVNNMNELDAGNATRLSQYAAALRDSATHSKLFALYGGYFSVLLTHVGLSGSSHGVGFSEHRDYRELAASGAAPARFYVEPLHRYLNTSLASEVWRSDPSLVAGSYESFDPTRDPLEYEYHDLMEHSVRSRAAEIALVRDTTLEACVDQLSDAYEGYLEGVKEMRIASSARTRLEDALRHLPMWISILAPNREQA